MNNPNLPDKRPATPLETEFVGQPATPAEALDFTDDTGSSGGKKALRSLGGLIFIAIIVAIVVKLDFLKLDLIWAKLQQANPWWVAFSLILLVPFIALKALRWQSILDQFEIKVSLPWAWRVYAIGIGAGAFTPGQAGDILKAWYLKNKGFPILPSILSTVVDRLFDLGITMILAGGSLYIFRAPIQAQFSTNIVFTTLIIVLVLVGIAIALAVLFYAPWRKYLLKLAFNYLLPARFRPTGDTDILDQVKMTPRGFLRTFALSLLAFSLSWFRTWCMFKALGLDIGVIDLVATFSLVALVSLVPIAPAGIGARDAVLILIFGQIYLNLSSQDAKAFAVGVSTLMLLLNTWNFVFGIGVTTVENIWRTAHAVRPE